MGTRLPGPAAIDPVRRHSSMRAARDARVARCIATHTPEYAYCAFALVCPLGPAGCYRRKGRWRRSEPCSGRKRASYSDPARPRQVGAAVLDRVLHSLLASLCILMSVHAGSGSSSGSDGGVAAILAARRKKVAMMGRCSPQVMKGSSCPHQHTSRKLPRMRTRTNASCVDKRCATFDRWTRPSWARMSSTRQTSTTSTLPSCEVLV